jgi:hypothetical protein
VTAQRPPPAIATNGSAPRPGHEALQHARGEQITDDWKASYRIRAGIEGTISQAIAVNGSAAPVTPASTKSTSNTSSPPSRNLIRLDSWWTGGMTFTAAVAAEVTQRLHARPHRLCGE